MWNPFKAKISGPELTFLPSGCKVRVLPGTTVLAAALAHKVALNHACDGNMACSTCHIYLHDGAQSTNPPSGDEHDMLDSADNVLPNSRLACQVSVYENLTVEVPSS